MALLQSVNTELILLAPRSGTSMNVVTLVAQVGGGGRCKAAGGWKMAKNGQD